MMSKFLYWLLKISGVLSALLFAIIGTAVLIYGGIDCGLQFKSILFHEKEAGEIIAKVLKSLDIVFLGIVIQILGIGLFELFVHPIKNLPKWLLIHDFDQLKGLLAKASVMVITISFVGKATTWEGGDDIIYYGVGIAAIIASLSYFIKIKGKSKAQENE